MSLHRRIFLDGSTSEKELKEELTRVLTADKCSYSYCLFLMTVVMTILAWSVCLLPNTQPACMILAVATCLSLHHNLNTLTWHIWKNCKSPSFQRSLGKRLNLGDLNMARQRS